MSKLITIAKYLLASLVSMFFVVSCTACVAVVSIYNSDATAEVQNDKGEVIFTKKYPLKNLNIEISEEEFIINGDTLSNIK